MGTFDAHKPTRGPLAAETAFLPCAVCGHEHFFALNRLQVCRDCRPAFDAAFAGSGA